MRNLKKLFLVLASLALLLSGAIVVTAYWDHHNSYGWRSHHSYSYYGGYNDHNYGYGMGYAPSRTNYGGSYQRPAYTGHMMWG